MATKCWTLTDTAAQVYVDNLTIGPEDVEGPAGGYSVTKRRLQGGLSDGVDTIRVSNGVLTFDVLPTRGMGLWKAWLAEEAIGWKSPVAGPVHPQHVPLAEPSGLGWLDGFDELLVRCGLESNGAPDFDQGRLKYPLHGRIANRPAQRVGLAVDGDRGEITVTGVVEETRFLFGKLRLVTTIGTRVGQAGLWIRDEVQNLSGTVGEMQLLYHVNFGEPLLDAGSRLVAPVKTLVPRDGRAAEGVGNWDSYPAAEAGFAEQVYFMELLADQHDQTRVLLKNAHGRRGVSLLLDRRQLPWFTLWKNTAAVADGYVTGLEPGTNLPNPRSFEAQQGRVVKLPPGGSAVFDLRLELHGNAAEVEQAEQAVAALQSAPPQVHDRPQKGWAPY